MNPDIYIKVRFRTTEEGGRKTPLKRKRLWFGRFYACPMIVNHKAYDCRLLLGDMELELGIYYEVPVIFLDKGLVLPNLSVGTRVIFWEGKEIADAQVTRYTSANSSATYYAKFGPKLATYVAKIITSLF